MDRRLTSPRAVKIRDLDLLGQLPSPELRRTARLAAHLATTSGLEPMAAIHLLDDTSQHRVAGVGVPLMRTPVVQDSMCEHVVAGNRPIYTVDATGEDAFTGKPFTTGDTPVRLYYATPLRTSDGVALGTLCVFATETGELAPQQRARLDDLASQTSAHLELLGVSRHLAHLATHDPLTDVANRLLLSRTLEAALADPDRRPHEPALLLIDLDDFKTVNDAHGHTVGDEVLRSIAARLQASVRGSSDQVARIGGDEFAVLLTDLPDPTRLDDLADRITDATTAPHATSAGPVECRASVGRTLGQEADLAYELLGRADADMYARKQAPA